MKGARRKRASHTGFADLMTPHDPHAPTRGIITTVNRPNPPLPLPSAPTSKPHSSPSKSPPSNADQEWDVLLKSPPKRRLSPQKPIIQTHPIHTHTTPSAPFTEPPSKTPPLVAPAPHAPPQTPTPPPRQTPVPSTPLPSFLTGWDGADGWGDDHSPDPSDDDNPDEDPWGDWPELESANFASTPPAPDPHPPAVVPDPNPTTLLQQNHSVDPHYHSPVHSVGYITKTEQVQSRVSPPAQPEAPWGAWDAAGDVQHTVHGAASVAHGQPDVGLDAVGTRETEESARGPDTTPPPAVEQAVPQVDVTSGPAGVAEVEGVKSVGADWEEGERQEMGEQVTIGVEGWGKWAAVAGEGEGGEVSLREGVVAGGAMAEVKMSSGGVEGEESGGVLLGNVAAKGVIGGQETQSSFIDESFVPGSQHDGDVGDGWGALEESVGESGGDVGSNAFEMPRAQEVAADVDSGNQIEADPRTIDVAPVPLGHGAYESAADLQGGSDFYEAASAVGTPQSEQIGDAWNSKGSVGAGNKSAAREGEFRLQQGEEQELALAPVEEHTVGKGNRAYAVQDNVSSHALSTEGLGSATPHPLTEDSSKMQEQPAEVPGSRFYSLEEPPVSGSGISTTDKHRQNANVEYASRGANEFSEAQSRIPSDEHATESYAPPGFDVPPPQTSVSVSGSFAPVVRELPSDGLQSQEYALGGSQFGHPLGAPGLNDYHGKDENREPITSVNKGNDLYHNSFPVEQIRSGCSVGDEAYAPTREQDIQGTVAEGESNSALKIEEAFGSSWDAEAGGGADPGAGSWNWADSCYNPPAVSDVPQSAENVHNANDEPTNTKFLPTGAEVSSDINLQAFTPPGISRQERVPSGEGIEPKLCPNPSHAPLTGTPHVNDSPRDSGDLGSGMLNESHDSDKQYPGQMKDEGSWIGEVRSTDVDVSSTIAGTDVPSVAGPSSVADETEWDPEPVAGSPPALVNIYAPQSQTTKHEIKQSEYLEMDQNKVLDISLSGNPATSSVQTQASGVPRERNTLEHDASSAREIPRPSDQNVSFGEPPSFTSRNTQDANTQTIREEAICAENRNHDDAAWNETSENRTKRADKAEGVFSWDGRGYEFPTKDNFESSFPVGAGEYPQHETPAFDIPGQGHDASADNLPGLVSSSDTRDRPNDKPTRNFGEYTNVEGNQGIRYAASIDTVQVLGETGPQVPMVPSGQAFALEQRKETEKTLQPKPVFLETEQVRQVEPRLQSISHSTEANSYWAERLRSKPSDDNERLEITELGQDRKDAGSTAINRGVFSYDESDVNESGVPANRYLEGIGVRSEEVYGGQPVGAGQHLGAAQNPGYHDVRGRKGVSGEEEQPGEIYVKTGQAKLDTTGQWIGSQSLFPTHDPSHVENETDVNTSWSSPGAIASDFGQSRTNPMPTAIEHAERSTPTVRPHSGQREDYVRSQDKQAALDSSRDSSDFQNFTDEADFSAYAPRPQATEDISNDFSSYAPITSHSHQGNRKDTASGLGESNATERAYDTPPVSESPRRDTQEPPVDNETAHFQQSRSDMPEFPSYSNQPVSNDPIGNHASYDASGYSSSNANEKEVECPKNDTLWTQNFVHGRNGVLGGTQSEEVPGWGQAASFPPQPVHAPLEAGSGLETPAQRIRNTSENTTSSVGVPSASSVDHSVGTVQEQLGVEDFYGNHTFETYAPRPAVTDDAESSYFVPEVQAKLPESHGAGIPAREEHVQSQSLRPGASPVDRAPLDDNSNNYYEGTVPFPPKTGSHSFAGPHPSGLHETNSDRLQPPGNLSQADPVGAPALTMNPEIHSGQGIDFYKPNTSEVALDKGIYSYPFSIMDAGPSGGLEYRPPRPVISWGFGGSLVTTFPGCSVCHTSNIRNDEPSEKSHGVRIYDLGSILKDVADDDIVAIMEALTPPNFPAISPDLLPLADMCERLANKSVGLKTEQADGRSALWRLLALMCKNCTSDWRSEAGSAISGPTSVPMFGRGNSSSFLAGQISKESPLKRLSTVSKRTELEQMEAAAKVERLITQGNSSEAIRVAQEAGLWSLALVLASTLDRDLYHQAISAFAKSNLNDGSALQTLCLTMADNDAEILRKATSSSGLLEWRKSVGILLTSRRSSVNYDRNGDRYLRLIEQVGDALISHKSDYVAGHVCYLISGRIEALDVSQIPMLGGDRKIPAGRPRSYGSPAVALQSLVFEAIANVLRGEAFPHILPFRLILAEAICSTGRPDVALKHCESMSKSVRSVFEAGRQDIASHIFTPPFLASLESLEQKLRAHLGLEEVTEKRGTLTSLGQSLSAVLSRTKISSRISTAMKTSQGLVSKGLDSRSTFSQPSPLSQPMTAAYQVTHPSIPPVQGPPILNPALNTTVGRPTPANSRTPQMSTSSLPGLSVSGEIRTRTSSTNLQAAGAEIQQTSTTKQEAPSSNERWNSFVSRTIGVLAPADGDLSPPPPSRSSGAFPMNADPAPSIGLGHRTGTRTPGYDLAASHMRSASMGDMPMGMMTVPNVPHEQIPPSNVSGTNQSLSSGNARSGPGQDRNDGQRSLNGTTVQKAMSHVNSGTTHHRRSTSDMTIASQTSERKPPRPPRRAPSASVSAIETSDGRMAPKGWSSRFRERLMSAFRGPPRAHMGNENKFVFDRERGRWVIEGEDPEPEDDVPPPPPDDDAIFGSSNGQVQTSVSYDNLHQGPLESQPQQLPRSHSMQDSRFPGDPQSFEATGMAEAPANSPYPGSYNTHHSSTQWGAADNFSSRDNISETSGTSSTSAQVPLVANRSQSLSPAQPAATPNRFRSQSGRRTGRRAYVDTFNKGQVPSSSSGSVGPIARPVMPGMAGLGGKSNSFNVFTPSPAPSSGTDFSESSAHQVSGSFGAPFTQRGMNDNAVSSENFMPRTAQGATSSPSEQYNRIAGNSRLGA